MIDATENPRFQEFMKIVDKHRTMGVRTNADTPEDARVARSYGAEGIGLFRTEHMFYGKGSDEPLFLLRKMILSNTTEERQAAAQRAVSLRQEATSRTRWRRWTGCRSRSACSIRRCTSSCRRTRRRSPTGRGPEDASRPTCRSAAMRCTRPTP